MRVPQGSPIRPDVDRARLITESFDRRDGQPWAIRQAKAFAHLCENLPIFIKAGELIVGDRNCAPDELRWHPEIYSRLHGRCRPTGSFSDMVTDAEREEIVSDICPFWKGRSVADRIKAILPQDLCQDVLAGLSQPDRGEIVGDGPSAMATTLLSLFEQGVQGRIETAKRNLRELDQRGAWKCRRPNTWRRRRTGRR